MKMVISNVIKDLDMIRDILITTTDEIVLGSLIESYDECAMMTIMNKIDSCEYIYFPVSSLYDKYIDFLRLYAVKMDKKIIII